ncbi:hypothetical protein BSP38_150 [Bacillus phage BSP38]|uniref:Uncharacterized protein n=1 Tax=Bacillus phage BSP38 TaxID=2283013 RepID=A0A345MK10_BPBSP|nr:hypothetical protein HWB82_gp168 [Bacillus phage BSP38]AXH71192.1 hypothetical protein BSP38_150 [Bacillus phage BSP38]
MNLEDYDIVKAKGDQLTYMQRGVLWVNKKPEYIVELVREPDLSYVRVYGVHPGTQENPQKRAVEKVSQTKKFLTSTALGRWADQFLPSKKTSRLQAAPPLFIAPVVKNQVSTFTGKREAGFFEREPDRYTVEFGEQKYIRGRNTGVFIGLSSIVWEDKKTISTQSLVETLKKYKNEQQFFDLTSKGEDKNNPLSSLYNED